MIPVLYYHRVGPFRAGAPKRMTVTPENFRRQMEYLRRRKYAVAGLDGVDAKRKAVALTFDDGYLDLMEHGVPVLRELGFPAAFFIVAGALGGTDAWYRDDERIMDPSQVRELARLGFTIGSHSMTHATLDRIPLAEARREIVDSKKKLEDLLGARVDHFAYPKGHYNAAVADLVREAGYRAAWATQSGDGSAFARRRFSVSAGTGIVRFAAKLLKARLGYYR